MTRPVPLPLRRRARSNEAQEAAAAPVGGERDGPGGPGEASMNAGALRNLGEPEAEIFQPLSPPPAVASHDPTSAGMGAGCPCGGRLGQPYTVPPRRRGSGLCCCCCSTAGGRQKSQTVAVSIRRVVCWTGDVTPAQEGCSGIARSESQKLADQQSRPLAGSRSGDGCGLERERDSCFRPIALPS